MISRRGFKSDGIDETPGEKLQHQSFFSSMRFFSKHSFREIKRNKCYYCISCLSCFLVVLFTLTIVTILDNSPLIFLSKAEGEAGQIDFILNPECTTTSQCNSPHLFINKTRIDELYPGTNPILSTYTGGSPVTSYPGGFQLSSRNLFKGSFLSSNPTCEALTLYDSDTAVNSTVLEGAYCFDGLISADLLLIDTVIEKEIECGRNYHYASMNQGECMIHRELASLLEVKRGDAIYINLDMEAELDLTLYEFNKRYNETLTRITVSGTNSISFPCFVKEVFTSLNGKLSDSDAPKTILMEISPFLKHISSYLPAAYSKFPPNSQAKYKKFLNEVAKPEWWSDFVIMNLPKPRISSYLSSNYDNIQMAVTSYGNSAVNNFGFFPVTIAMPLLSSVQNLSMFALYIGLVFDIVIFLFAALSTFLLYTLLMISVETRTFEIAVFRMVGLNKRGIISLILLQAFYFVLPSILLGFSLSFGAIAMCEAFFEKKMGFSFQIAPSGKSVAYAIVLGLIIPLFASFAPIKAALSANLTEALDYTQSKTKAIYVEILHSNKRTIVTYLTFGFITVVFGIAIYYFLPFALLSMNIGLLLWIFFIILIGMLVGLALMALNLQSLVEIIYVYVFLFFEKVHMKKVVLKNLAAHKSRNNMTAIMYSIGLGFFIFLLTALNLQLSSVLLQSQQSRGNLLEIRSTNSVLIQPAQFEPVIAANFKQIESFAWVTYELSRVSRVDANGIVASDVSRVRAANLGIYGVTPSIYDTTLNDFLKISSQNKSTGLSLGEQLYTARGSQSVGSGEYSANLIGILKEDPYSDFLLNIQRTDSETYFIFRCAFELTMSPAFQMTDKSLSSGKQNVLVSLPTFRRISKAPSMSQMFYERLMIKLKPEVQADRSKVSFLKVQFRNTFTSSDAKNLEIWDFNDMLDTITMIETILNYFFLLIIAVVMVLCFFSLTAAMTANAMEQTKEIAVLRAMGYTKNRIIVLYMYEAFILVFSSATLGVLMGIAVGWTMTLQQVLFTGLPLTFYFPKYQSLLIFAFSLLSAVLSSFFPLRNLLKKQIAQIVRMT